MKDVAYSNANFLRLHKFIKPKESTDIDYEQFTVNIVH
jgi:hypothetical protein